MGNIRLQIAYQILQTDFSTSGLSEVPFNLMMFSLMLFLKLLTQLVPLFAEHYD